MKHPVMGIPTWSARSVRHSFRPTRAASLLLLLGLGCGTPVDPDDDPMEVDDAPVLVAIADVTTEEETPVSVGITITDETPLTVIVAASSSNETLIGVSGLTFSGSGASRTLVLTPAAGQSGTAMITVTATDAANQTASDSFQLTVNAAVPAGPFSFLARIEASDGDDSSEFGQSVALSGDFMAVGTSDAFESGTTYVLRNDQGTWTEVWSDQKLGNAFGFAVAMDGDYLAASRYSQTFIYSKDSALGDMWTVVDSVDFGVAVSMSGDRLLVTDRSLNARVLTRSGSSWPVTQALPHPGYDSSDPWGPSAAIEGDVAVLGAPADDDLGSDAGAAYVYRFNGSSWLLDVKLTASDGDANDLFGRAVSLSGNRLVVGAPQAGSSPLQGAVYIFEFDGTSWVESDKLTASDGRFGFTVDIQGDEIVVGAPTFATRGQGYHFTRSGSTWTSTSLAIFTSGNGNRQMGYSIALDGNTVVLGTPGDDEQAVNAGAVFIFSR